MLHAATERSAGIKGSYHAFGIRAVPWAVDAKLLSDFPAISTWQSPKGEVEDEWHQGVRARFWAHLLTVLPTELHRAPGWRCERSV